MLRGMGYYTRVLTKRSECPPIGELVEALHEERQHAASPSLGADELAEFVDELEDGRPASSAEWLASFLPSVKAIYAFQHLSGSHVAKGDEALRAVKHHIWGRGDAIIQADLEGFTNEDGFHILWQFAEDVSGTWWMALLQDGAWVEFEMDLGDPAHREHFFAGRMPPGAKRR